MPRLDERDIAALAQLVDGGRWAEAEARARDLVAQHPQAGLPWKVLGVALRRQGKDALAALQKTVELMPGDDEAQGNLGSALHDLGRWADALACLRRALRSRPDDAGALVEAGNCLRELGQLAEAVTVYQQALRLDRRHPEALNNLGNALLQIGQPREAVSAYRLALDLRPDSALVHFNLANALRQLGQFDESLASSRRALAIDPGLVLAHNNLGLALMGLGNRPEAIASFRAALAGDPGNVDVLENLGAALHDNGESREADAVRVRRIRALMERRRFGDALAAAEALVRNAGDSADLLLTIAICQRMLLRHADALGTLDRLQSLRPGFSRLHQERGYCHASRNDAAAAIEAFASAVVLNPALLPSWKMLESLYQASGQDEAARLASAQVAALGGLPPALLAASSVVHDGDLASAEMTIRGYLDQGGSHVEAIRLLGCIALLRGVADDARSLFERVLEQAPDHREARYDYARALMKLNRHHQARAELDRLVALDPDNPAYLTLYASASGASGRHEEAVTIYRRLIDAGIGGAGLQQWLGNALKALGRSDEAVAAYRSAAAVQPDLGIAWWSLADLKTYRFSDDEVARMQGALDAPSTTPVDRYHLCFALGKAFEDGGDYARSFEFYARGNELKRRENRYQPDPERITARQIETFSAGFLARRTGVGCPRPDPIFVVGLPRSGSTLIEQILASHSRVEGTKELTELPGLVLELQGRQADAANPRYPRILTELDPADFLRLGERYLEETRVHRGERPYFVDKLSGNFRHIGLIHLILPNAKIIDARREPMACCFSNFKQLFASGQEFTYGLDELARYYRSYLELMRHWDRVLPGRVLRVHHEDVVNDLEGSVRRMLDYCGLEFEPACLEFHRNARSVRTASSEQVRRPIFREGLDQWKHFEPWLGGLQAALGDALTGYRWPVNRP